jgi:hypothetical protein
LLRVGAEAETDRVERKEGEVRRQEVETVRSGLEGTAAQSDDAVRIIEPKSL